MKVDIPVVSKEPPFTRMLHNFQFSNDIIFVLTILIIAYFIKKFALKKIWNNIEFKSNILKIYNYYLYISLLIIFFVWTSTILFIFIIYIVLIWLFLLNYIKIKTETNSVWLDKQLNIKEKYIKIWNNYNTKNTNNIKIDNAELNKIKINRKLSKKDLEQIKNIKNFDIKSTKDLSFQLNMEIITVIVIMTLISIFVIFLYFYLNI